MVILHEHTETCGDGKKLLEEKIIEALRGVHDPEIPVNIYDLGLIYRLDIDDDGNVAIDMTLTTPACPVAEAMPCQVECAVREVPGVRSIKVELVWDPPWSRDRLDDFTRLELGLL
ncbi:MAG TPA: SUF system Fe-S cluster assembly protein [Gammaproteobacteria bacterium]|nr:SUF system Fe-S cluster assembly protein [Gammaproteobacteria bacterium]